MLKKFKEIREWFRNKKSYLLAVETIIEIVFAFLSGDQGILEFVTSEEWLTLKGALAVIFVRAGINNSKKRWSEQEGRMKDPA